MKRVLIGCIIMIWSFGLVGIVNAEEEWNYEMPSTIILSSGEDVTNNEDIKKLYTDYDVYYKYVKIDDELFSKLGNGVDFNKQYFDKVKELIPEVNTIDDLSSWTKAQGGNFNLSGLEYSDGKDTGYYLAVAAVSKNDSSKIYVERNIFVSTSTSTLTVKTYGNDNQTIIEDETEINDETTNTKTTTNPNTGISDYLLYIVPIIIICGSLIVFRKKYI